MKNILSILALLFLSAMAGANPNARFHKTLNPREIGLKKEKLTHLHFFVHDVFGEKNPTAIRVAAAPTTNTSATGFGFVAMMDDPVTVGPDPGSRRIGAAQGIYGGSSQTEWAILMVYNFVFADGKFNGSTLSVLGRTAGLTSVSQLAIVGGTGIFRFGRGYALVKPHVFNVTARLSIMEYNVYVVHY